MMTIGAYDVLPLTVKSIIDPARDEASKSGRRKGKEGKGGSFPIIVHYIYIRHIASGILWRFVGVKRNGEVRFSDGRHIVADMGSKPVRMTADMLRTEIGRLIGNANALIVVATMFASTYKGSDVREMLAPLNDEIAASQAAIKARNDLNAQMAKR